MKRLRLDRWGAQFLSPRYQGPRPRVLCPYQQASHDHRIQHSTRFYRSTPAIRDTPDYEDSFNLAPLEQLPSPPPKLASSSAKLAALHARLSLPSKLPLHTLARCLVDASADPSPDFNNSSLAILGSEILGYHTSEYLLCHYPRLPMTVLFAAQYAYVGPKALRSMTLEWGVEVAAEPGGEVDPGLLQLKRLRPEEAAMQAGETGRPNQQWAYRRGISSRIVYDDQFGDLKKDATTASGNAMVAGSSTAQGTGATDEEASKNFVRALVGAVYLHAGRAAAKRFFEQHFLSRQLELSKLFDFKHAPRDLSRLCAREGFESPVARLISETGRLSRHPVFVVGVYSGNDKLGEGAGASLDEARIRAAAAALKGWYLYSPMDAMVPSDVEGGDKEKKKWEPAMIDIGEIIT
ncbi:60S ribosomal protein L3 [Cryomyces antarcticus]|nr:hypothetical protein LTR04_005844 [Oleoguttula sp. CCFEE 6159]